MKMWPGSPLAVKLTGLSLEEIVNLLLTDELTCFRPDYEDEYLENTLGRWKLKDRASAERTLRWVKKRFARAAKASIRFLKAQSGNSELVAFRLTLLEPGVTASVSGSLDLDALLAIRLQAQS